MASQNPLAFQEMSDALSYFVGLDVNIEDLIEEESTALEKKFRKMSEINVPREMDKTMTNVTEKLTNQTAPIDRLNEGMC